MNTTVKHIGASVVGRGRFANLKHRGLIRVHNRQRRVSRSIWQNWPNARGLICEPALQGEIDKVKKNMEAPLEFKCTICSLALPNMLHNPERPQFGEHVLRFRPM